MTTSGDEAGELRALPAPFTFASPPPVVLAQGAEGILFKSYFLDEARPCAIKFRPVKTWRHPTLDARLTRHRILSEARILAKCRRDGINVPGVLALDWEGADIPGQPGRKGGGWMMMEWIHGLTLRASLDGWLKDHRRVGETTPQQQDSHKGRDKAVIDAMTKVGTEIGRMHSNGIIHGDLTTSNLMINHEPAESTSEEQKPHAKSTKPPLDGEIVLIDFGLAAQSVQDEDRAVDLYVLERAFSSTHPDTEDLFEEVLKAYAQSFKGAKVVLKRLEEVRMRGRKRSMIG